MSSRSKPTMSATEHQPRAPAPPQGFIFDMDGVLCDSEDPMAEASCRMFRELHGVAPSPEEFREFMGRGSAAYFGGVARRHGVEAVLPRDRDRTYEIFRDMMRGRLRPLPGAVELIERLRSAGRLRAVATSADPIKLHAILDAIGIPAIAFDALVTAEDVERNKPAPDIFLCAAARLGCHPSECVVVEDTPPGISAALAAGMRCLGLWTTFPRDTIEAAGPHWMAANLASVPPRFFYDCGLDEPPALRVCP